MANKDDNENSERKNTKACCVLGGRGFIGSALVDMLLRQEKTNWIVTIVDRYRESSSSSSAPLARAIDSGRASYLDLDHRLTYKSQIIQAFQGVSVVFYIDDMDSFPTDFYSCYQIIVQGAKDVLSACRQCKVKQLIYNSSADVVFDDVHDIRGGDESLPYSGRYWGMVSDLRAQAEALVIAANDIDGLLTCALRPCNIFGPGDNQHVPMLVNLAKSNWAKFIIGSGNSITDFTYVDNVAHAHICAEESLSTQMVSASGKVFFVTNMEPMEFWEFASLLLGSLGYQRPVISLPVWIVSCIVYILKSMHLKSDSKNLDPCTSSMFVAALALRTRTFNCSEAQRHIQYKPIVSMEEAMALTVDSFSHLATDSTLGRYDFDKPSQLDKLFSGKVADILLWRDEKGTFFCFLCLALLYHWFFLSGRTFISSSGELLLLTTILLCGNHILPLTVCGFKISRLSPSFFEISEVDMRIFFFAITYVWNNLCSITKSLAVGEDWSIFLKAASFLYFCKLIIPHYFAATIGLVIVIAFTTGFIYEQYQKSFGGVAKVAINIARKAIIAISRNIPFLQNSLSKER